MIHLSTALPFLVIPAKAGIHLPTLKLRTRQEMDSRLRGNDGVDRIGVHIR